MRYKLTATRKPELHRIVRIMRCKLRIQRNKNQNCEIWTQNCKKNSQNSEFISPNYLFFVKIVVLYLTILFFLRTVSLYLAIPILYLTILYFLSELWVYITQFFWIFEFILCNSENCKKKNLNCEIKNPVAFIIWKQASIVSCVLCHDDSNLGQ